MSTDSRHSLGRGKDVDQRVTGPWPRPCLIGVTGPQIKHWLTRHRDGDRGAILVALLEVFSEGVFDAGETGFAMPFNMQASHLDTPLRCSPLIAWREPCEKKLACQPQGAVSIGRPGTRLC